MRVKMLMLAGLGALALSGCVTTAPIEVTRFNIGTPIPRGTIDVEPFSSTGAASLAYQSYAAAVQSQLLQLGYSTPAPGQTAHYLATVNFLRTSRGVIDEGPPVTLGLGVGGFGRRVGGGVGGGIGIGKHRERELIVSELSVQIKDRANGSSIWEGRAQQNGQVGRNEANPTAEATKLASALFRGFPGESGRTIRVK